MGLRAPVAPTPGAAPRGAPAPRPPQGGFAQGPAPAARPAAPPPRPPPGAPGHPGALPRVRAEPPAQAEREFTPEPMFLDTIGLRRLPAGRRKAPPMAPPAAGDGPGGAAPATLSDRLFNEGLVAGAALVAGLVVSPVLFFFAAPRVIGAYTHGTDPRALGVFTLLKAYFGELAQGSQMAWVVALGPLLMVCFARLMWTLLKPRPEA